MRLCENQDQVDAYRDTLAVIEAAARGDDSGDRAVLAHSPDPFRITLGLAASVAGVMRERGEFGRLSKLRAVLAADEADLL